jgi:signal peptidase I
VSARQLARLASWAGLATCLALAAAVLLPAALGYQRYVITSGSMSGTYDRGSLVYAREVPTATLRVGDVITYAPPPTAGPKGLVTHRIVWMGRDRTGAPTFRTKGDANAVRDPWRFTLQRPQQVRAAFHVPYVGFALAALGIREVRMLLIGLPALLIAVGTLARLWHRAGVELRRREAAELRGPG